MSVTIRKALLALLAAFAVVLAPISAHAAYPPTSPAGQDVTVMAGTPSAHVKYTGFAPGEAVTIKVKAPDGTETVLPGGPFIADASGNVEVDIPLPANTKGGDVFTVVATGPTSGPATLKIFVKDKPVAPAAPQGEKTTVKAGQPSVDAHFTGFKPGESITEVVLTAPNGTKTTIPGPFVADANGNLTVKVPLPAGTKAGDVFGLLANGAQPGPASLIITVTSGSSSDNSDSNSSDSDSSDSAGNASNSGGSLPNTGSTISPSVVAGGFALLVLGAGIVLFARRRQNNES